jgi:NTE family protein
MLPSPVPKPDRHGPLPGQGGRRLALVLGGGNALGAYLAGAYERLHGAGLRPDLIVGASIGAVTGAILAGNPPEHRVERLHEFWAEAALHTFGAAPAPAGLRGRQAYTSGPGGWRKATPASPGPGSAQRSRRPACPSA